MTPIAFDLAPFPGLPAPGGVQIAGTAARSGASLHLVWRLESPAGSLAPPGPIARPERRRALWEGTCFEFFLARAECPGYWEFNLSPAGHWNVYRFDAYRAGMTEETAFESLPFSVSRPPGRCEASACIDTTRLGIAASPWRLAVATVVSEPSGRVTFWALSHPGIEPDFHLPESFGLRLGL